MSKVGDGLDVTPIPEPTAKEQMDRERRERRERARPWTQMDACSDGELGLLPKFLSFRVFRVLKCRI